MQYKFIFSIYTLYQQMHTLHVSMGYTNNDQTITENIDKIVLRPNRIL